MPNLGGIVSLIKFALVGIVLLVDLKSTSGGNLLLLGSFTVRTKKWVILGEKFFSGGFLGKFLFSVFGGTVLLLGSVFFMGGVVVVVGWVLGSTKVIFCSWVKFSGEFLGGWGFFSGGIVPLLGSIWW